jgi:CPA2 family monovalent cation:H+ antiporter-2
MAEVGVVLLLFTIGLEFSFRNLFQIRRSVLLGGTCQVGLTFAVVTLLGIYLGQNPNESVLMGFLISLSSTAIVMKIFQDRAEMDTPHGNTTLGILIYQDIIVVPMMLSIPLLAGAANAGAHSSLHLVAKITGVILVLFLCARWAVPWVLFNVARTRSREMFLLTVLALCLAVAWLTHMIGLSLALGAFLAGLVISESEYSQQALGNILPFKDVFTSFFFVSIGMLFDLGYLLDHPILIVLATAGILAVKSLLACIAALAVGLSLRSSILAGLSLSQVGEFSFILAGSAMSYGLLRNDPYQAFLSISILSMMAAPFMVMAAPKVAERSQRLRLPKRIQKGSDAQHPGTRKHLRDHLVIVGFGLNGRNLAKAAAKASIPYDIIEMNPSVVRAERRKGEPIHYGDATQEEVLHHADVENARAVVIVINDPAATRRITEAVRRMNRKAYILVRTRYTTEIGPLKGLGADEVIPEEFETSVEIFSRILEKYLLPKDEIEKLVCEIRTDGYQMFRSLSRDSTPSEELQLCLPDVEITSFAWERIGDGREKPSGDGHAQEIRRDPAGGEPGRANPIQPACGHPLCRRRRPICRGSSGKNQGNHG